MRRNVLLCDREKKAAAVLARSAAGAVNRAKLAGRGGSAEQGQEQTAQYRVFYRILAAQGLLSNGVSRWQGCGQSRSADFQVCCIAGFQTCQPSKFATALSPSTPAHLEVGDTAGLETCATTELADFVKRPGAAGGPGASDSKQNRIFKV